MNVFKDVRRPKMDSACFHKIVIRLKNKSALDRWLSIYTLIDFLLLE